MSPLDAVRRPEYTGEHRCWPCTVVNAALLLVVAALVAVVSPPLALVVLVSGGALVALRGYVVPYTPRFAPRLVAPLPFAFGPRRATDGGRRSDELAAGADDADGERVTSALLEAGVLVADEDGVALAPGFADGWTAEMARLRALDDDEAAAAVAAAAPFEATGRVADGGVAVEGRGPDEGRFAWLTRARAFADAGAVRAMADHGVPGALRAHAAPPLRMFVPECPTTGGPVEETTYRNCCGGPGSVYDEPERPVLACADTDEVLFEFASGAGAGPGS